MAIIELKTLISEIESDATADEAVLLAFLNKVKSLISSKIAEIEANVGAEIAPAHVETAPVEAAPAEEEVPAAPPVAPVAEVIAPVEPDATNPAV